jgi:hypothetical protein
MRLIWVQSKGILVVVHLEKYKDFDWYKCIEEPVRELVLLLRNNGFNTECSCGHEMYVQCQYIPDGEIMNLHNLVYDYLHEKNLPIRYDIDIKIKVR